MKEKTGNKNEPDFSQFYSGVQNEVEDLLAVAEDFKNGSVYEKINNTREEYISQEGYTDEDATEAAWYKHKMLVKRKLQENEDAIDRWIEKNWLSIDPSSGSNSDAEED